jgi:hypothetical protein
MHGFWERRYALRQAQGERFAKLIPFMVRQAHHERN